MQRTFAGFTTKALLTCVVLGAATAVAVQISRLFGVLLWASAPWLGAPAPMIPWFMFIIVAPLLVPRFGAALIAGLVGAVFGFGTMALIAAIIIELVFFTARKLGRGTSLVAALIAGVGCDLMAYGFMFLVPEFQALSGNLVMLALGVRIVSGLVWGVCAWLIARGLERAGFRAERPARRAEQNAAH